MTSHRASAVLTAFSLSLAMVGLQSVLQLSRRAKAARTTTLALLCADVLFTGGFALSRFPPGEPIPNVALAVSAFELAVLVSHLVATGWAGDLLMRRRETCSNDSLSATSERSRSMPAKLRAPPPSSSAVARFATCTRAESSREL